MCLDNARIIIVRAVGTNQYFTFNAASLASHVPRYALFNHDTLSHLRSTKEFLSLLSYQGGNIGITNTHSTQMLESICQLISQLPQHPNVKRVFGVEVTDVTNNTRLDDTTTPKITRSPASGWSMTGNVLTYLSQYPDTSTKTRLLWVLQVGAAIKSLHNSGIIHGDVHLGNILLEDAGQRATLINTGIYTAAQVFLPRMTLTERNLYKSSNENELDYVTNPTKKMDYYSFAVSVYSMFKGSAPYQMNPSRPNLIQEVAYIRSNGYSKLQKPANMPANLWVAVQACLQAKSPANIDNIIQACEQNL